MIWVKRTLNGLFNLMKAENIAKFLLFVVIILTLLSIFSPVSVAP